LFGLKSNIAQKLTELSSQIKEVEPRVRRVAGTTLLASNIARIHNEGKAVDDSRIGSYSTKPAYFSPERSPKKFTPKGKNGKSKFANGKRKKTRYFSNGYKGLRQEIGRQVNTVDLSFTGKLSREFGIDFQGRGFVIGWTTKDATAKAVQLENKYGKRIWGVSKSDQEDIDRIAQAELNKIFNA